MVRMRLQQLLLTSHNKYQPDKRLVTEEKLFLHSTRAEYRKGAVPLVLSRAATPPNQRVRLAQAKNNLNLG